MILDDLGIERNTEYSLENLFNVIDARYVSGKAMIITTNLNLEELKNQKQLSLKRIYDRVLERCIPVCVSENDFRKDNRVEAKVKFGKIINGARWMKKNMNRAINEKYFNDPVQNAAYLVKTHILQCLFQYCNYR